MSDVQGIATVAVAGILGGISASTPLAVAARFAGRPGQNMMRRPRDVRTVLAFSSVPPGLSHVRIFQHRFPARSFAILWSAVSTLIFRVLFYHD